MNTLPLLVSQAEAAGSLAGEYAKMGVLGLTVIALASALVVLWRDNIKLRNSLDASLVARVQEASTLQAQRVADSQAVTDRMVAFNTQCVTVLTNVANNLDASREASGELRATIKEAIDEMKRGRR